ncbi:MAG: DUF2384 domain-containing protein, partial [Bacteroidetes bacterium]
MSTKTTNQKIVSKYKKYLESPVATVMAAHEGVPATAYGDVAQLYGHKERIAELLNISTKTIKRYQHQQKRLNASISEMLLKMVAVFDKGVEVFGEDTAFLSWLERPAFGLGNYIPLEIMKTSDGIDLVMEELVRIEYGD